MLFVIHMLRQRLTSLPHPDDNHVLHVTWLEVVFKHSQHKTFYVEEGCLLKEWPQILNQTVFVILKDQTQRLEPSFQSCASSLWHASWSLTASCGLGRTWADLGGSRLAQCDMIPICWGLFVDEVEQNRQATILTGRFHLFFQNKMHTRLIIRFSGHII